MNATLVLVQPDGSMREVPIKRGRLLIGREKKCDVRIPLPSVSREHAEVKVEDDEVLVRDMGSSNGTYVNRTRVQQKGLAAGDLVAIGPAVFVVRLDGEPAAIDAARAYADGSGPKPAEAAPAAGAAARAPSRSGSPAKARPTAPRPAPATSDADDDIDINVNPSDESSVADFDFDFLDEDDDAKKQPKL